MSLKDGARIKETTLSTGSGALTLGGASAGHRSVAGAIGDGNQMLYYLLDANGLAWECGLGTVTAGSPDTFSRDTIISSSNSGSAISLSEPSGSDTHFIFNAPVPGYSTGDINMMGKHLIDVAEPVFAADLTSGVVTLDCANGGIQVVNLTENVTSFTLTNFTAGKALTVYFIQDATGGRSVDFSQFRTAGGEGIALSDAADAVDVVVMLTIDGSNYDAGLSMGALA